MEWLFNLIGPGHMELASTLVLYSFVIAAGVFLGKLKIAGVSLGVTFVLFVGIIMGHFGYVVNPEVLKFVREFGLILFIFSIGIQVGPGFFSSFKKVFVQDIRGKKNPCSIISEKTITIFVEKNLYGFLRALVFRKQAF